MSKTLKELIEVAAEAYPDHFLQEQLTNFRIDMNTLSLEEVLAVYIVEEFRELYDPGSSDQQNVQRIASSLERSMHTLERVAEPLRELSQGSFSQSAPNTSNGGADKALLTSLLERLRPGSG